MSAPAPPSVDPDGRARTRGGTGPEAELVDRVCRAVADVPGDVRHLVRRQVDAVAPLADPRRREELVAAALARLVGLDGLDVLLRDPDVDEVLVNRGGEVWVDRAGVLAPADPLPAETVPVVIERILAPIGRRLDRTSPIVDARLPDGSRVCAVIPPVSVDGTVLSIRRLRTRPLPLAAFCDDAAAAVLRDLVERRCNVLVAGATSSGKTSLLAALLGLVAPVERIVVLEDTAELSLPDGHVVRLEARPASADGLRAIGLDELVRTAMRLRPDRLVVGEVRGAEVLALVQAINTGHDGSMSTCHANGAVDALHRLESLVLQAAPTWPLAAVRAQLTRSIDAIVVVGRGRAHTRRVCEIAEVEVGDGPPTVRSVVRDDRVVASLTRSRTP